MLRASRLCSHAATFYAKDVVNKATPTDSKHPDMKGVGFGTVFAPHMLECDWNIESGWGKPVIRDFGALDVSPTASGLQYGLQCFEGLKAYRCPDTGKAFLFRPDRNAKRMMSSMDRLTLPTFETEEFVGALQQLVSMDKEWIPALPMHSLYIRPTAISTSKSLSVAAATDAKLFIICSPVGPYYPTGFKPVRLFVDSHHHRAWPGGTGDAKIGPNYAGPISLQVSAAKRGFGQVLWLGPNDVVDEVGAMNFMCLWRRPDGIRELVTAPIDGTILPGITRDSILTLARDWGDFEVSERRFTIHDIVEALNEDRVEEMFGCGTAAIVTAVNGLHYEGTDYEVPCPMDDNSYTMKFMRSIVEIQTGKKRYSDWCVDVP